MTQRRLQGRRGAVSRHYEGYADCNCWWLWRTLFGIIWINRARVSGTPCFYATRVPVKAHFDYLGVGETLEQFLDDFEGVDREQALAVLDLASKGLVSALEAL